MSVQRNYATKLRNYKKNRAARLTSEPDLVQSSCIRNVTRMQPLESPADDLNVDGEFHHFQLVNADGEIPLSISILVHVNQKALEKQRVPATPITANEVLEFHEALSAFNGDFISAFSTQS